MKVRLIWRNGIADADGRCVNYEYKTDVIELPDDANAFTFPDFDKHGYLPECIGAEWMKEDEKSCKLCIKEESCPGKTSGVFLKPGGCPDFNKRI